MNTWNEVYEKYLQQPECHRHGIISTLINQRLCDICEKCDLMLKALIAAGVKGLPPSRCTMIKVPTPKRGGGHYSTTLIP